MTTESGDKICRMKKGSRTNQKLNSERSKSNSPVIHSENFWLNSSTSTLDIQRECVKVFEQHLWWIKRKRFDLKCKSIGNLSSWEDFKSKFWWTILFQVDEGSVLDRRLVGKGELRMLRHGSCRCSHELVGADTSATSPYGTSSCGNHQEMPSTLNQHERGK